MGTWIYAKRSAKNGKGHWVFYDTDKKIAESYKYPNLFNSQK